MKKLIFILTIFTMLILPLSASARTYYQSRWSISDRYITTQTYRDYYGYIHYREVWQRARWHSYWNSNGYYQYYYVWQNYYRY